MKSGALRALTGPQNVPEPGRRGDPRSLTIQRVRCPSNEGRTLDSVVLDH